MTARGNPFDLLFAAYRSEQFPAIRQVIGTDRRLAAFLLAAPAVELLRDLRSDDALGESIDDFVQLVHAAYWYWHDGERLVALDAEATRASLRPGRPAAHPAEITRYIQVAPRLIWCQLGDETPFEPLDGWFATCVADTLRVVACFGVHPERPGLSVASVIGPPPTGDARRADGTALFAPLMPGGDAAGLHAIATPAELLLLAWQAADTEELP